jgi:hypothetical protein
MSELLPKVGEALLRFVAAFLLAFLTIANATNVSNSKDVLISAGAALPFAIEKLLYSSHK